MSREFNYTINSSDDLNANLKSFFQSLDDEFRATKFKLYHDSYKSAANCFVPKNSGPDFAEDCLKESLEKVSNYEMALNSISKTHTMSFSDCAKRCQENDFHCVSACFNEFASKMYSEFQSLHSNLKN
eukprot:TRINITY_DN12970_c0_g1_i1.p1 TRINITY_DN12970_c0_g1~~TRINITY_DN12970_c0_g1_i1.p1  ORF type:complete len:128 (+),score=31.37 TRINITY_DN12970_c0_g1_i1:158-541(+)